MNLRLIFPIVALLAVTGCSKPAESGSSTSSGSGRSGITVGMVFDSGGLGDKSFNDSAKAGLDKAEAEFRIVPKTVQSANEKDYETNLEAMASAGCKLVFAVGVSQNDALKVVAPKHPDIKFAIVDSSSDLPNVRGLLFNANEGSFLAGYLAALMSKTHKIGFVGGMDLDLIKKFYIGYAAGAKTADASVEVLPAKYVGSWDNQDTGHADAQQLFGTGADVVYHAAGRAGLGVLKCAKEQGKYAIGVDGDQDGEAPGYVLTSMIKHVDEAVFSTISDVVKGSFTKGDKVYDLASGGVGLSAMTYTKDKIGAANLAKVDKVSADIKSGKIKVPTTQEELNTFVVPSIRDSLDVARLKAPGKTDINNPPGITNTTPSVSGGVGSKVK